MKGYLRPAVACFWLCCFQAMAGPERLKPMVDFREKLGDPTKALTPEIFKAEGTLWLDHTSGYLVPKYLYYDQHPEYFALRTSGQRIPKTTRDSYIHLCLSHPDVVRIATERMLGWIRLQPDKTYFCVTQGDGLDWCQCENCRAMDVQPGNYSDRLLKFVNKLARAVQAEFPEKILLTAAYCGTDVAPLKEKPERNVWVMYAPYWGLALSEVHPLTHPANAEALSQLNGWLKVAPENMAIYDYNMYYCPSWDAMAEKLKYYAARGIRGVWFCGEPMNFRDLFHQVVRVEMMKDPNQDPEKLKRDFVQASYGPAAPYVMEYLNLVKERLQKGYPRGIHNRHMPLEFYTDENVGERCRLLFEKMIAACDGLPALKKKFVAERDMFVNDWAAAEATRKARAEYRPTEPETIPGGLRFPATAFSGGKGPEKQSWYCEPRIAMTIYAVKGPYPNRMETSFSLKKKFAGQPAKLKIEGQDADKDLPPSTPIRISLNGKSVFEGPCGFVRRGWSWRTFELPAGLLREGGNVLEIINTMPSARLDHYWFSLAEALLLFE